MRHKASHSHYEASHSHYARGMTTARLVLDVNGTGVTVTVAPTTPLLHVLRNDLGCNGPRYGCGLGECGACAVLIDGEARRSCTVTVGSAAGHAVVTLEGLGTREDPHPVQAAFIDAQAAQCGYCLNGMIIATAALLARSPNPSRTEIVDALAHQLCRCGAHVEIMEAIGRAIRATAGSGSRPMCRVDP